MDIRLQVSLKFRFVSFVQFHMSKHSDFLHLAVLMCRCHDSLIGTPAGRRVRGCGHGDVKSGIQGRKENSSHSNCLGKLLIRNFASLQLKMRLGVETASLM